MTSSAPRIAFVLQDLSNGMLYHQAILDALGDKGVDTRMIAAKPPLDGSLGPEETGFLRIKILPSGVGRDRTISIVSPAMIRRVLKARADMIVCVEYSLATFWAIIAGKLSSTPIVIYQEHFTPTSRLRGTWRGVLRRLADHFIANTDAALEQLSSQTSSKKCTQIAMPVPPEFDLESTVPFRPDFVSSGRRFLFAGRFIPLKNIGCIVDAAARLRDEGHRFTVLLVGSGPEKERIVQRVSDLNLSDHIHFIDRVEYAQMAAIYAWCDVFIMPTWDDYRSVAVLEAMRAGKPVIDSLGDGNAGDSVRNNHNGLLFEPSSPDELATAMRFYIQNPDSLASMGERSAEYMIGRTPANAASHLKQLAIQLTTSGKR